MSHFSSGCKYKNDSNPSVDQVMLQPRPPSQIPKVCVCMCVRMRACVHACTHICVFIMAVR